MTVTHSVSLGSVHRQVLCHCRVYNGQRQSWNLCACVAGLHCSFVRVKHEVLLWWCPRGSIPRNLDKNIEWNNISSFSCPVIADGISHYPKLLQCWLSPGVFSMDLPVTAMMLRNRGVIQSGDFPEQQWTWSLGRDLGSLLFSGVPLQKTCLTSRFFFL